MPDAISQVLSADISWLWISARTLGICAWLASSVTVIVGLTVSSGLVRTGDSRRAVATTHRIAATLTLGFVLAHIATLIPDPYARLTLLDAVVPGMAPNQTFATALGTIAFLGLGIVSLAGIVRSHMSARVWKGLHSCAYIVWPLASFHFILMGTDVMASWSLAMIGVVGLILFLLLLRRGFATDRPAEMLVRSAADASSRTVGIQPTVVELFVTNVIAETRDAKTFCFALTGAHRGALNYLPGQHLTLQIPSDQRGSVARCYSLSSTPGVDAELRVTVKRTPGGYGSNWLCDNLRPGMIIRSLAPAGSFTVTPAMTELLLFAGGSGITPLMSIIKHAMGTPSTRVTLVYANRDPESIIFGNQLAQLANRHRGQLTVRHWLASESGLPTANDVTDVLAQHRSAEIFVCGPAPYMDLVVTTARSFGWPTDRVHIEEFRSLAGDPFEQPARPARSGNTSVMTRTSIAQVELDGDHHVLEWPADSSLVHAMFDAGIDPPYSCLEGVCSTCECRLVEGTVASGSRSHDAGSRVLGCQVRPTSDVVALRF